MVVRSTYFILNSGKHRLRGRCRLRRHGPKTGHHVEAHGMWHMLLLNDYGIGQIEQIRYKSRIMHCSMFHMNIKSQDL